jgi:spore coat assembly protein
MQLKKGDLVTRNSYNNDTLFKIINIKGNICYLKGIDVRLYADSDITDLEIASDEVQEKLKIEINDEVDNSLDRSEFFYLPGKILHIDADNEYLERCLNYYKEHKVFAIGKKISEVDIPYKIRGLLEEYKPDIVIITGHDAYYQKKGKIDDIRNYKNTENFIKAVKECRNYEKSHEKLVIIAGACQSNYEELIKAGANFASSPKRVNIHCLDPAIIATSLSLTERNREVDLIKLLEKTKYGKDGMGGLVCNGLMYVGYPR